MSITDTRRVNWLERNPDRLVVNSVGPIRTTFKIQIEKGQQHVRGGRIVYTAPKYSPEHVTLRGALDEGIERIP